MDAKVSLLLVFTAAAVAQAPDGSIVGTIRDPSGAQIPAVAIDALHVETGRLRTAATNDHGDFVLNSLEPGHYMLTFTRDGFKRKELRDVVLGTHETLPLTDLKLEIGGVSETVSVTATEAGVATRSSERADLITSDQIADLVVQGRNFMDLMQLIPGVVETSKSQDLSTNPSFYVAGSRNTTNNITIDGVASNDMGNGVQMKMTVSQDAVSEVKVLTSNYQAEYGRMAGSNVIVVTKSGTRMFHGLGSFFLRNEDFNANNFFNNLNGIPRPIYRYKTVTYNISGPVIIPKLYSRDRSKLFFYWGQEFWPTTVSSQGTVTVPTALERSGDFSQSLNLGQPIKVTDPLNGNAQFPSNRIPTSRLDGNGLALLNIFPLPNFTNTAISGGTYNYVFSAPRKTPLQTNTGKVDYLLSASDTLTANLNTFRNAQTGSVGIPSAGSLNWPLMVKTWAGTAKGTTERWTHIFNPKLLNEFSFSFLTQPADDTYTDSELKKILRSAVGFNAPQFSPAANDLGVIPDATFGGVSNAANLWVEGRFPLYNRYHIFSWTDNLTLTRGSHTLKAGVYVELFTRTQKKIVAANGIFDFQNNANNPLNTGYAYSNAALGSFYSYSQASGRGWMHIRDWDTEAYLQDNWKVTRRLTLDYGLRVYWTQPMTDDNNAIAGFVQKAYDPALAVNLIQPVISSGKRSGIDPATGQIYAAALIGAIAPGKGNPANGMVQATNPGSLPNSLVPSRGAQWGPRFGFAYDVFGNGKTAIRGGLGIFYNRLFTETFFSNFVGQPPNTTTPTLTYGQLSSLNASTALLSPSNVYGPDGTGKLPTVMNYSVAVQRDIGFRTVVDIAYAGTQGRHLQWFVDQNGIPLRADFQAQNQDPTTPGKPYSAAFLRPIRGYNSVYIMAGGSSSNYNSLQVSGHRRFAHNFQFGAAWTWSKAMDYNDNDTDTIQTIVPVRSYYYGLAGFDRTHNLTINYIYDLPGSPWKHAVAKAVLSDWQLSGITSFQGGAPTGVSLTTTNGLDITGSPSLGARVDLIGNPVLSSGDRTFARNFNTSAIALPAVGTYGNSGKTLFRGPGISNWNAALLKNLPIHERLRMQLRFEAYNVFNHTQFSALNTTANFNPATGQQTNAKLGTFTAARDPRQMQLAVRLTF